MIDTQFPLRLKGIVESINCSLISLEKSSISFKSKLHNLPSSSSLFFFFNRISSHRTSQYVLPYTSLQSLLTGSVQFSCWSCLTLCDPMDCSMPGLPVHQQFLEFTQTHVHWVSDALQPSHALSSPSPPTVSLSPHPGLFKWVSFWHQVAKVLEFQHQHQSFQWIFRTDFL